MFPELTFVTNPAQPGAEPVPRDVAGWVRHIREQDMPAFGATVAGVTSIAADDRASVAKLSQIILRDAAMTTKVLKLANSAFHNPARQPISTISRAVVVLGFDVVSHIAVGIALVDALLKGGVRQRVVDEMAHCFHAAVQARALALARRDPRAEEIFIAALLARVGDMAFWCFGGEMAAKLDTALQGSEQRPEDVQQTVLGFRLRHLTLSLAKEWRLGSLLNATLEAAGRPGPSEQAILLGQQFAVAVEKGWESPETKRVLERLGDYSGTPLDALMPVLVANAEEAARLATVYGAEEAARRIPLPKPLASLGEEGGAVSEEASRDPDPMLQLRILRELSALIAAGGSLNEVLNLTLEGMYRGIGLDRVLFALMAPNRTQLIGKAGLGRGAEALTQSFVFSIDAAPGDVVNEVMGRQRSVFLAGGKLPPGLRLERLALVASADTVMIAPIVAQGRAVGLFYGDRGAREPRLGQEDFEAFQHFVQQVCLAFANAAQAGRKG